MTTKPTAAAACRHCGATIEHHRGIDRYCGESFATTFWNPENDHITEIYSILDNMAEEIEKLKLTTIKP